MKCPFCKTIGSCFSVDIEGGRDVPREFERFETLAVIEMTHWNFPDRVMRCPDCRTIFYRKRRIDNEIGHASDEVVFEEISPERADELIRFVKSRKAERED